MLECPETIEVCRKSGNVYSYKANWRVAGEPAILKFEPRPVAFFFWCIHVYNAFAMNQW